MNRHLLAIRLATAVVVWICKPYLPNTLSQSYLNDVICIPFWVPIMLFAMRKVRLRRNDSPPASYEILIPLLVWSYYFECVAPYSASFRGLTFGDPLDILSYSAGALLAAVFWRWWYTAKPACTTEEP